MPSAGKFVQERKQADDVEQTELLGEAKMDEFTQYQNSLGARAQMRELRTMLAESAYMLRDDQFAPMVSALAAEQQRHRTEREKLYNGTGNPTNTTPQEVISYMAQRQELIEQSLQRRHEIAATHLDSEQLKRYDEMLDRERRRAQIEYDLFVTTNEDARKELIRKAFGPTMPAPTTPTRRACGRAGSPPGTPGRAPARAA